jgi:hypothetical protein
MIAKLNPFVFQDIEAEDRMGFHNNLESRSTVQLEDGSRYLGEWFTDVHTQV